MTRAAELAAYRALPFEDRLALDLIAAVDRLAEGSRELAIAASANLAHVWIAVARGDRIVGLRVSVAYALRMYRTGRDAIVPDDYATRLLRELGR